MLQSTSPTPWPYWYLKIPLNIGISNPALVGKRLPSKIKFVDPYFYNLKMIRFGVVDPYRGLSHKWSAVKVEATCYNISWIGNSSPVSVEIFIMIVLIFCSLPITYKSELNTQWPISLNLLFIGRKPIIGYWLLPTGDSSTISEYTYIFDILLIEGGNFAWKPIFAPNSIYSTARFREYSNVVDCNPNPSFLQLNVPRHRRS